VSKIAKFQRYEQLERLIEETELGLSRRTDHISARRLRAKLNNYEAELTELHQELHAISIGSPYDPVVKSRNGCDVSGCDYVFRDDLEHWRAAGLCPRHDPSSPGLEPNDPNYKPGDTIAPMNRGGTR
jgi:hypothetical protein